MKVNKKIFTSQYGAIWTAVEEMRQVLASETSGKQVPFASFTQFLSRMEELGVIEPENSMASRTPTDIEKAQLAGYIYHDVAWRAMIPSEDIQAIAEKAVEESEITVYTSADDRLMLVIYSDSNPRSIRVYAWSATGNIEEIK